MFFVLKRYATSHPQDPFSVKNYFSGWKMHPVVFDFASQLDNQQVNTFGPLYMLELRSAKTISNSSTTVILPVTEKSSRTLELTITGLLEHQSSVQEVVILCPDSFLSTARSSIRHVVASYGQALSTLLTLMPCFHTACGPGALIETTFHVSTDWVLLLEDSGLRKMNEAAYALLLNPPAVTFPLGLKGFALSKSEAQKETCIIPSDSASHHPADFLVPPFVLPSVTFSDVNSVPDLRLDSWSAFGRWVSEKRPDAIGGVVVSSDFAADSCLEPYSEAQDTDNRERLSTFTIDDYHSRIFDSGSSFSYDGDHKFQGQFGIFFPSLDDLSAFSQVACALVLGGHRLDIFLYAETAFGQAFILTESCALHYHSSSSVSIAGLGLDVSSRLSCLSGPFDVVITLTVEDDLTASLPSVQEPEHVACTVIRLPREDLSYSDWMGALSLVEWQSTPCQSQSWCCSDSNRLECASC
jgi:hypothetical protein